VSSSGSLCTGKTWTSWCGTGTSFPEKLRVPLPGNVQDRVGWGFEQPGLVKGVSVRGRGVGIR